MVCYFINMRIVKKILIILLLIFSSNIFAKEYTSSVHNLKITLPDSYTILNSTNIAEVYKNIEGRVPKETLEQMVLNYKNIPIEFYVDETSLVTRNDNIMDNINIASMNYKLEDALKEELTEFCIRRRTEVENAENREIKKFKCEFSDKIKDALFTRYTQHENKSPFFLIHQMKA